MSSTTIAVAGFAGKFARLVTGELLAHPDVRIYGICHDPSKLPGSITANPHVQVLAAASDDSVSLRVGLKGASACICCYLGADGLMLAGRKTLIDACIDEHLQRFVPCDFTLDFRALEYSEHQSKDAMKHAAEYLDKKQGDGKIEMIHVLNSVFMEFMLAPFLSIADIEHDTFRHWGTGDEPFDMITYADAARFTATAVLDESANEWLKCTLTNHISLTVSYL